MNRRAAMIGLVVIVGLFVVELFALATGNITLAAGCGVALVAGWFVLRSAQRRG